MRGKPIAAMIALAVYRITPADAGKTQTLISDKGIF